MPPAAAERTHTAPIDGATTFDSPFSAVLLAAVSLSRGQRRRGRPLPLRQKPRRPLEAHIQPFLVPLPGFSGRGIFVHKTLCTSAGETTPLRRCAGYGFNRRRGRRSVAGSPVCRMQAVSSGAEAGGAAGRVPPFLAEPPGGNRRQRQKRQTVTIKSAGAAGGGPAPPEKKQRPAPWQTRTQEQGQQKQPTTARPPRSPLMNATRRAGWRRRWLPQRGKEPQ